MQNKNKRAQVTIFIIVAVVIIVGIVGFFLMTKGSTSSSSVSTDISNAVGDCIEEAAMNAIYWNGLQGGYYNVPEPRKSYEGIFNVPFYWVQGAQVLPSKTVLEQELAKSIKFYSTNCNQEIENNLNKSGDVAKVGEIKEIKVSLLDKSVKLKLNWPITIIKDDSSSIVSSFEKSINFDIIEKQKNLADFIEMQKLYPTEILLTRMANFSADRGFTIEGQVIDETKEVLYSFVYSKEIFNNRTYNFMFGARY
jgi:hypothetical protein